MIFNIGGKGVVRRTLTAGQTEITIYNSDITVDSALSFYTSIYGVNPKEVVVQTGYVKLVFDSQVKNMEVGVRVDG